MRLRVTALTASLLSLSAGVLMLLVAPSVASADVFYNQNRQCIARYRNIKARTLCIRCTRRGWFYRVRDGKCFRSRPAPPPKRVIGARRIGQRIQTNAAACRRNVRNRAKRSLCLTCVAQSGRFDRRTSRCIGAVPFVQTTAAMCRSHVRNRRRQAKCYRCVNGGGRFDRRNGRCVGARPPIQTSAAMCNTNVRNPTRRNQCLACVAQSGRFDRRNGRCTGARAFVQTNAVMCRRNVAIPRRRAACFGCVRQGGRFDRRSASCTGARPFVQTTLVMCNANVQNPALRNRCRFCVSQSGRFDRRNGRCTGARALVQLNGGMCRRNVRNPARRRACMVCVREGGRFDRRNGSCVGARPYIQSNKAMCRANVRARGMRRQCKRCVRGGGRYDRRGAGRCYGGQVFVQVNSAMCNSNVRRRGKRQACLNCIAMGGRYDKRGSGACYGGRRFIQRNPSDCRANVGNKRKQRRCIKCTRRGNAFDRRSGCLKTTPPRRPPRRRPRLVGPPVLVTVQGCQLHESNPGRRLNCVKCVRRKGRYTRVNGGCAVTMAPPRAPSVAAPPVLGDMQSCRKFVRGRGRTSCVACVRRGWSYIVKTNRCQARKRPTPRRRGPKVLTDVRSCQTHEKNTARRLACVKCTRRRGRYFRNNGTCSVRMRGPGARPAPRRNAPKVLTNVRDCQTYEKNGGRRMTCIKCVRGKGRYFRANNRCSVRMGGPAARPGAKRRPSPVILTNVQMCKAHMRAKRGHCIRCVKKGGGVYDKRTGTCTRKHHRGRHRIR